jgi:hypothetical protein
MAECEDDEVKSPFDRLTRPTSFVVLFCSLPVYFIFNAMGESAKGLAASIMTGMIITAVILSWDMRKHIWYWITLIVLILLHVPLIQYVPWSDRSYPGMMLLPHGLLDLAVVYGCIKLVEMLMTRKDNGGSKK